VIHSSQGLAEGPPADSARSACKEPGSNLLIACWLELLIASWPNQWNVTLRNGHQRP
jgi:hypothetical protein